MSRCKKCRYFKDYPMSCKNTDNSFPFCGFKQKTKQQIEMEEKIEKIRARIGSIKN